MATGDRKRKTLSLPEEELNDIQNFQERAGYDDFSPACRELIKVGMREQQNPIVYRLKDRVVDWVSIMAIAAVMVLIAGKTTSIFAMRDATLFSLSLIVAAVLLLAGYELLRLVAGSNELGVVVRDAYERLQTAARSLWERESA